MLRSPRIKKVGVRIEADFKRLFRDCGLTDDDPPFVGAIELSQLAVQRKLIASRAISLASLVETLQKQHLPKPSTTRVSLDWAEPELSDDQKEYAARNVYAIFSVYESITRVPAPEPVTKATPGLTPVLLLARDESQVVAHGYIKPNQPTELQTVNITKTRVAVTITNVLVPAYMLPAEVCEHRISRTLSSFGPPQFHIVCKLKHLLVHSASPFNGSLHSSDQARLNHMEGLGAPFPDSVSDPVLRSTEPTVTLSSVDDSSTFSQSAPPLNPDLPLPVAEPSLDDDTFLPDIFDESIEHAIIDAAPINPSSFPLASALLQDFGNTDSRNDDQSTIFSRFLGDIWHLMHQLPISVTHGLRAPFSRALRDAIFILDPEDKAAVDAVLVARETTFEKMMLSHPEWVLRRVKRFVPAPHILTPRIATVFAKFGPLTDAATNKPLFNQAAWDQARNILQNVQKGFYSDPPGVQLYYLQGLDKDGLMKYYCCRGTNNVEGGVHQNLRRKFDAFNASTRFALALLRDYVYRHNQTVSVSTISCANSCLD